MCDHTRKLSNITLSQENIFSFSTELWHFQSQFVPKNVKFSEGDNYFIITNGTTLKSLILSYIALETKFLDIFA